MKTGKKNIGIALIISLVVALSLTGCKPSKKKVLSSSYYKELKKENKKLKKENKSLKSKVDAENDMTEDEQRASDYLEKISRDHLVKLEVGYADNMDGSDFVEEEAVFSLATSIAARADKTTKYTPDEVKDKYGPGYEYILYDEDNAIYEIMVYGGNYIVFADLPNNVYYAYDASAIGDAFLHYKNGYPNSRLFHRLADTPLIINDKGRCYENEVASSVATYIDQMSKKKSNEARAKKKWGKKATKQLKKGRTYTFYHHGNTMKLVVYDEYFTITNMNGKTQWYHAEKEAIVKLKDIFKEARQKQKEEQAAQKAKETSGDTSSNQSDSTSESDASNSHRSEMESEGTNE